MDAREQQQQRFKHYPEFHGDDVAEIIWLQGQVILFQTLHRNADSTIRELKKFLLEIERGLNRMEMQNRLSGLGSVASGQQVAAAVVVASPGGVESAPTLSASERHTSQTAAIIGGGR